MQRKPAKISLVRKLCDTAAFLYHLNYEWWKYTWTYESVNDCCRCKLCLSGSGKSLKKQGSTGVVPMTPVQCKCSFLLIRLSFRYIWLLKKRFHNRYSLKCFTRSPVYHLDIFTFKMKAIVALHKKIAYFTLRGESDTKIWIRCLSFTQRH